MTSVISSSAVAQQRRPGLAAIMQQPAGMRQIAAAPQAAAQAAPAAGPAVAPAPAAPGTVPPGPSGATSPAVASEMKAFGVQPAGKTAVPQAQPVQQVQAPQLAAANQGAVDDPFRQTIYSQLGSMLGGGLDRSALVQQQYANMKPMLDERFNAAVEQTGQRAAAFGRGGMGGTTTAFTNLARQRGIDEQTALNDLILQAKDKEFADRFQALGLGTDLSRLASSDILAREQMGTQRDITGAQLGMEAGRANQSAALQQALQGQQLGFQAGESAATRQLQAGLQGQELGMQRLNTLDSLANQRQVAQIGAGAQMAASQAAANASIQAAQIGASAAQQRQAAELAFNREVQRQSGMMDLARLEEQQRQFDTGAAFNQQAFQYGMGRDATSDYFRSMDMLGQYGYLNEPSLNAANAGLQSAYGQGVGNYGANAAQINQGLGQAAQAAATLYGMGRPTAFPGINPETLARIGGVAF